eukprot:TRINITY_DN71936_c0_g1_i1.p1 TRINITY_DN71936_c0_g1~~TRINITY_DN71936_c0_g1_i1.p1  ORF type:complete len:293 (-),score=23.99 TRINITY_DN71936_c0_g1_i1:509-1387(-)
MAPLWIKLVGLFIILSIAFLRQHADAYRTSNASITDHPRIPQPPSIDELNAFYGSDVLGPSQTRVLYKKVIADYAEWPLRAREEGADDQLVAAGCNLVRHRIKLYARSRQSSWAWTLRIRDTWAHGIKPAVISLWRTVFAEDPAQKPKRGASPRGSTPAIFGDRSDPSESQGPEPKVDPDLAAAADKAARAVFPPPKAAVKKDEDDDDTVEGRPHPPAPKHGFRGILAPLLDIPFCLLQHPDYPCPSVMALLARKGGDHAAVAARCFQSNLEWSAASAKWGDGPLGGAGDEL